MIYTQSQVVDYNMHVYLRINMFAFVGKQLFFLIIIFYLFIQEDLHTEKRKRTFMLPSTSEQSKGVDPGPEP